MSPRREVSMTPEEVHSFLESTYTAALSSISPDGIPHTAAMWFLPGPDEIRMWTYAKSQKARNLMRDPACSFMTERGEIYSELRGVQVRGHARVTEDFDEISAVGRALYERYTLPKTGIPLEGPVEEEVLRQATKRVGIVLPMLDVSSWDHSKL
jgi:PPOX class probable F420-dependent enzyme